MDYAQYKKLRQEILEDCNKRLEALEMVWRMIQGDPVEKTSTKRTANGDSESRGKPFAAYLRTAIKSLRSEFNADDVQQALIDHGFCEREEINRLQITNSLHRLYRRGELVVVKKGKGKQGSIYRQNQLPTEGVNPNE